MVELCEIFEIIFGTTRSIHCRNRINLDDDNNKQQFPKVCTFIAGAFDLIFYGSLTIIINKSWAQRLFYGVYGAKPHSSLAKAHTYQFMWTI